MKELSIEQKAKAYDEAITKFKPIYDLAKEQGRTIDVKEFERIFPELKESEDERKRNFISNELACLRATDEKGSDRYEELTNAIAWLKSFKDRYTWKPSDYQMEALESAIKNCAYSEYQDCLLELIEQLKRLKVG